MRNRGNARSTRCSRVKGGCTELAESVSFPFGCGSDVVFVIIG